MPKSGASSLGDSSTSRVSSLWWGSRLDHYRRKRNTLPRMFFQSWRTNTGRLEHFQIQPWTISSNDHAGNFQGTLSSFPETIILLTTALRRVAWWSSCSHYQLKPSRFRFCALCLRDLQVWAWVFTYFLPHLKDMYCVSSRQISFQHQLKRHYRQYQLFLVVCLAALLWWCNLPVVFYIFFILLLISWWAWKDD